jgi:hypothetical protein
MFLCLVQVYLLIYRKSQKEEIEMVVMHQHRRQTQSDPIDIPSSKYEDGETRRMELADAISERYFIQQWRRGRGNKI